eukprot:4060464-Amphidinium_carterae.1
MFGSKVLWHEKVFATAAATPEAMQDGSLPSVVPASAPTQLKKKAWLQLAAANGKTVPQPRVPRPLPTQFLTVKLSSTMVS